LSFEDLLLREAHEDIALRDARALGRDLGDDRARLELVSELDLLLRGELAAHGQDHVERALLDRMQVARGHGLRGRVGRAAAAASSEREAGGEGGRDACTGEAGVEWLHGVVTARCR
jgi:hypothetical protein